ARVEQRRGELRARVLDRKPALRVAGQIGHGARLFYDDACRADGRRCDALGPKFGEILVARGAPRVHAQTQWRPGVARVEDRCAPTRVLLGNSLDPPTRIGEPALR